jgi:hypothetical protein
MLFRTHTASRNYVVLGVDDKPFQRPSLTLHFVLRPSENVSYVNAWIEKGHTIVVFFSLQFRLVCRYVESSAAFAFQTMPTLRHALSF